MSVIASTPQQILNSPLNSSTAKFQYSFQKADRFQMFSKTQNNAFYDLPPVTSKRKAGIGYGDKYDFTTSCKNTPAPGSYDIKSQIDISKEKKLGKTFGAGREELNAQIANPGKGKPGPGAYQIPGALNTISFSFRPKTNDPEALKSNLKTPGPGTYQDYKTISDKGKYFVSKYRSSGATTINPARSERFKEFNPSIKNPGPGTYDQPQTIDKNGKYFVSRFRSSMCRSFSHAPRKGLGAGLGSSPGPGSYRIPSDFGYYVAKNAQQSDSQPKKAVQKEENKQ